MNTKLTPPPADWRESRRLRAWELHQQGWSQTRIAEALGSLKVPSVNGSSMPLPKEQMACAGELRLARHHA